MDSGLVSMATAHIPFLLYSYEVWCYDIACIEQQCMHPEDDLEWKKWVDRPEALGSAVALDLQCMTGIS